MGGKLTKAFLLVLAGAVVPCHAKLVHHWQFDEDAAATATAVDVVAGLNGTIEGPVSAAGKVAKALSFDGSNDRVQVTAFAAPPQGTIALWINPSLSKSKERFLGTGGDFEIWLRSNGELKNELFDNGSTTLGTGAGVIKANQWQQVALTYDGAAQTVAIYVNGEPKGAGKANLPSVPTATVLQFGTRPGIAANEYYKGLLDDIQMYDEVLAADQIKSLFQNPGTTLVVVTTKASAPSPADGAKDVPADTILTWTAGLFTVGLSPRHRVFFSAEVNDVHNRKAPVTQDGERYPAAGTLDLDLGRTYFWRVDEANSVTGWDQGDLWHFTVANYVVVDDFEDYNDVEPHRIFDTWSDGWDVAANGSVVGHSQAPFAEQTIVHGGRQSLPLLYDNTGQAKYSEAVAYLDDLGASRDWTARGVKVLSLWLRGRLPGNGVTGNQPEKMYVAIANQNGKTGTVYHPNAGAILLEAWTQWQIDLKEFSDQGVNLSNVERLILGFGDKANPKTGGAGAVYLDDIRLTPSPQP
ncbi:MAG: LamG domain-containing protein [Planctomycetes bacterium]|jgi:hypothetical protein|nr:LamG domain-containing protein [Planctomycetota bacterium]